MFVVMIWCLWSLQEILMWFKCEESISIFLKKIRLELINSKNDQTTKGETTIDAAL